MHKIFLSLLALMISFSCSVHAGVEGALLKTIIHAIPQDNPHSTQEKVQPGTKMQLRAIVRNEGDVPSKAGRLYIRFAFPKPLDKQENSVIFKTEVENLPSLEPGEHIAINFTTTHHWPSIFDFIRNDWAMREYEAITTIDHKELITGTRVISFSAYYYEGPASKKPVRVSSADHYPVNRNYPRTR